MYIALPKSDLQGGSDNTKPLKLGLTKSVLHSDWLLQVSRVGLSGSVDSHDSEAVQSTIIQVDHLKLCLLAGVWSLVHLRTAAGQEYKNITFPLRFREIKKMQ